MLYSITTPVTTEDAKEKVEILDVTGKDLMRESKEVLRSVSGRKLMAGKSQHVYFSKEIAQKGINEFLGIFIRDPDNPMQANLVVVDGSPMEMLKMGLNLEDKPRPAFYVSSLLKDARDTAIAVETRLYDFSILQYSKTIDPVLPFVRYGENEIEIAGSALFDTDKMVGVINRKQTILLNLLTGEKNNGRYNLKAVPGDNGGNILHGASVMIVESKSKKEIELKEGMEPKAKITLKLKMRLEEYTGGGRMDEEKAKKSLEEQLAMEMKSDCEELFKYMQSVGADPIGFGEMVRSKYNEQWKSMDWKEKYREMETDIKVEVMIRSYGVMR